MEERKALIKADKERGRAAEKISPLRNLVLKGLLNINDLKASRDYTPKELAAVSTSI